MAIVLIVWLKLRFKHARFAPSYVSNVNGSGEKQAYGNALGYVEEQGEDLGDGNAQGYVEAQKK